VTLRPFWFPIPEHLGIGVTAFDESDAVNLARLAASQLGWVIDPSNVVRDIRFADLDQNHVIPNMGVFILRGAWFPNVPVV
jgi:hypothetical protein